MRTPEGPARERKGQMADGRYELINGPRDRGVRAADSDREAMVELLRHEHAQGRLDEDELQERIERALAARTYGELDVLAADLPASEPERRSGPSPGWGRWVSVPGLVLLVAVAAVTAIGHAHFAWIAFPLFFLFVVRPLVWRRRRYWRGARVL